MDFCLLIGVAIQPDRNVIQEEAQKELKCKSFSIETQTRWNMKCFIMSLVTGATGIVTKEVIEYLEVIPGKHSVD
jgi:hypothetical protein